MWSTQTKLMGYYNYHGIAMKLISKGHCKKAVFVKNHNNISPALVLYFDNHKPMPIRENKFELYIHLLQFNDVNIEN